MFFRNAVRRSFGADTLRIEVQNVAADSPGDELVGGGVVQPAAHDFGRAGGGAAQDATQDVAQAHAEDEPHGRAVERPEHRTGWAHPRAELVTSTGEEHDHEQPQHLEHQRGGAVPAASRRGRGARGRARDLSGDARPLRGSRHG